MSDVNGLPEALSGIMGRRQWVGYKFEDNPTGGKKKKVPVNPLTGNNASTTTPATWGTYADAKAAVIRSSNLDGIGFVFAGGYLGVDLDDVVDADGAVKSWAQDIVERLESYTEYSPSGTGLHIIVKAEGLSAIGKRDDAKGIEVYNHARYFTVTGNVYGQEKPIAERAAEIRTLLAQYFPDKDTNKERSANKRYVPDYGSVSVSDHEVLEKAFNSKRGAEIRALYNGDTSAYGGDHSRADLALVSHLAYWTDRDSEQIDRLFRHSGLMRPKWTEKHGAMTYGQMTIEKACGK